MPRYFIARKAKVRSDDDFDWTDDIARPSTIEVCDHEATDTGLVDANGDCIMRAPNPIGFLWEIEGDE